VFARNAEQHRRHAEGERDVAAGGVLRLDEIHVLRRQAHRLPVEPAFEQQRPPGPHRAGIPLFHLRLQPVELLVGKAAALFRRIDQRARRTRRIVEQRLVPAPGGIVRVERDQRRLERREPVMIVDRVKQRQLQSAAFAGWSLP
jgi:hypothetical protein